MTRKPESRLQLNIRDAIREAFAPYVWTMKVHGNEFQREGIPDHIYCIHGLFFAFEVKRPGQEDTATDAQHEEIADIIKAKGVAAIINSADDAVELVRKTLARAGVSSGLRHNPFKKKRRRRPVLPAAYR